jgi:hypothetical protein
VKLSIVLCLGCITGVAQDLDPYAPDVLARCVELLPSKRISVRQETITYGTRFFLKEEPQRWTSKLDFFSTLSFKLSSQRQIREIELCETTENGRWFAIVEQLRSEAIRTKVFPNTQPH